MKKLQNFTKEYHQELNYQIKNGSYEQSKMSLLMNHMLLSTEVAEIAELLRELFVSTEKMIQEGWEEGEAFKVAQKHVSKELGKEISDCIAYLSKLGNFFERDMESDFYNKMEEVRKRVEKH
ncbi:hypothetical protein [Bacillus sp. FJAT-50079]|uniref:hypothetical protein n=1 Tax=Bacillus sp. FJAT-50079 TaxID=2833577 RepID=UPI001BC94DE1|nr:hypothetical protein [Bacillus sp. FJAT-50079]MBS4206993.1 hypothetical protein [Bacillus sp. FJAT-50079]